MSMNINETSVLDLQSQIVSRKQCIVVCWDERRQSSVKISRIYHVDSAVNILVRIEIKRWQIYCYFQDKQCHAYKWIQITSTSLFYIDVKWNIISFVRKHKFTKYIKRTRSFLYMNASLFYYFLNFSKALF